MPFTFLHLDEVDSTNAFLLRKQESVDICGCVVSADMQTAGKGMGANSWESESGKNLTFSMGVDMSFMKAADQFLLSQAVPLGLLDVLDTIIVGQTHRSSPTEALMVKWPNDLCYGNRKLCGILINNMIHGMDLGVSVIGIGLNVNQMQFKDWPTHPVSIKMILGKEMELEPLLEQLVKSVDDKIQLMRSPEGRSSIQSSYLQRMYQYRQWADYEVDGVKVKRFITGLDPFGRLTTIDKEGKEFVYDLKEIRFL